MTEDYNKNENDLIAYFSAEYGFNEALPVYSGGLGILSGDHLHAADILGLNFIGVGLFYKQGYFQQHIDESGQQIASYPEFTLDGLQLEIVKEKNGSPLFVSVSLLSEEVIIHVWQIVIGKVRLFLLDTDIEENRPQHRNITKRLYYGNREDRICQEVILGMGGPRILHKMGLSPAVWHLNEGHSAFIILELAHGMIKEKGVSFSRALQEVKKQLLFTTHTPVKAGNEAFSFSLIKKYFSDYCDRIGIHPDELLKEGVSVKRGKDAELFSMTILSLKNAAFSNGVSRLHGKISRAMWSGIWPDKQENDIPIDHVTNGINLDAWLSKDLKLLFTKYIGEDWQQKVDEKEEWRKVFNIPDRELWNLHMKLKQEFIKFIHNRVTTLYKRNNVDNEVMKKTLQNIQPHHLLIGFARRFAPYKRATLLFHDEERLKKICDHPERPVHFIFAGKSHPADKEGQNLIRKVYEYSLKEEFYGKILFLENYDISVARYMVTGSDIWLNNPRRPYEASGTSGQKAAVNGVINFSVLDGWWVEGYNQQNGWIIGTEKDHSDLSIQDLEDSNSLYTALEEEIIPAYYNSRDGISLQWIQKMKESIVSTLPVFNTIRMVKEYCSKFYFPLMKGNK
ncbi:MAG: alpha-glucan family phosphorylase [Spirochaetes bacterium]|nr:alpha-glucan family phosphorylase [Spirochaetota bacterium]